MTPRDHAPDLELLDQMARASTPTRSARLAEPCRHSPTRSSHVPTQLTPACRH